jgi:8-oxo-dGTP pyrophosphatase MutT (NUDIX family)
VAAARSTILITRLIHSAVYAYQALRRAGWFVTRPVAIGVHGVPLTPEGKLILVTLSYARGWRLPGGGRKPTEDAEVAMLRELREEIGMTDYASIELVSGFEHRPDHRRGRASLFVVRGVRYRPRWSLEVKQVGEFDPSALPAGTAEITLRLLALAGIPYRA